MAKRLRQAIDDRDQGADVGGVAGPQLRADRPSVRVDHHAHDYLHQIRPMILGRAPIALARWGPGVAALAQGLATCAGEAERGGVQEHHRQLGEEVAPAREQPLLDLVLDRTRGEGRRLLLLVGGQLFAQPGPGPIAHVRWGPAMAR